MIWIMPPAFAPLYALVLASVALAAPMILLNDRGSSTANSSAFAAASSINVAAISAAANASTKNEVDSYYTSQAKDHTSKIYGDWSNLPHVSAFHFMADMDIDCDGVYWNCPGNSGDGQPLTSFGALDSRVVPWYVLPEKFADDKNITGNALGAIICDGKMVYAIFGDTNGATPQVIGEGSLELGRACFPNDNISGDNGHGPADVTYIVFGKEVPTGVGNHTIDIAALKTLGDQQVQLLVQDLKLD
ncbi:fungal chitosanase of glycosyl hydrolase group 75-domain-containing protein [Mycena maculata]|uniref:Endo-chitosanase n=1 Tax=Mycena maculata TaxID=230809 RepID=A0AAD7NNS4_9AGAR|nr:fungal chitosanase of glycosyl hydrolase group 75-domain-containing protein [Mycena maculata]